jgi:transcription elongation factor Elf1
MNCALCNAPLDIKKLVKAVQQDEVVVCQTCKLLVEADDLTIQ